MLARMIYASAVGTPLGPAEVGQLLEQARRRNKLRGLTGLLVFDSRHFLQVLEGSSRTLSDLYAALLRDGRHRDLLLLKFARVGVRCFPDWSMGFVPADAAHGAMLVRHGGSAGFEPFALDGDQAETLLLELASAQAGRAATATPAALAPAAS
jgi:hypothetical protein